MVGLTRMILAKPKIIILDEPTASMDNDLESFVMKNLFAQASKDATIIFATHKLPLLGLADKVLLINKGEIMLYGPRNEVIQKISSAVAPKSNVKAAKTPS